MKKRNTIQTKLQKLMVLSALGTLFLFGLAMLVLFFQSGVANAKKEILYVLENTNQRVVDKFGFI